MCSPWDISSNIAIHPTTGFSGTNDTAALLPPHIFQRDLPKLKDTNEKVRGHILGEENNLYEALPAGFSDLYILKKLVEMKIPLLLDVGALILELSNVQVAEEWLKLIPAADQREAAVYFDSMDRLMVKDRLGHESRLELSPYRTRLGQCVIYLDDVHTRGTDLKMPFGTQGCVTLGKGVTRDKLVQGCMRMRQLGNGHSLQFMASQEVHNEITALDVNANELGKWSHRVFNWAQRNSQIAIRDGFLHWVNVGVNYVRKRVAHDLFNSSTKTARDFIIYGDRCSDAEATKLMAMYGEFRIEELFVAIAESRLNNQERSFLEKLDLAEQKRKDEIKFQLQSGRDSILSKCKEHVPDMKKLAYLLDEEQERELEHHLEQERHAPRPPSADPYDHVLSPALKKFIQGGSFDFAKTQCLMQLPEVFKNTKLWPIRQAECWGENIYATQDFFRVVKILNENDCVDLYLRPPTWIVSFSTDQSSKQESGLIFLSPFEANKLLPIFRSGNSSSTLHMFAPRLHPKQDTLLRSSKLWIPSTPFISKNYFQEYNQLNSNLLLFSGSQYFKNEEEQSAFCQLTGFIPRPRTVAEQKACDSEGTVNGFVKPEYRKQLDLRCKFLTNPEELIRGIMTRRHERFSDKCHVNRVVEDSIKEYFEDEQ